MTQKPPKIVKKNHWFHFGRRDIESYSSYSSRSASTSKAKVRGLSMAEIDRAARWSSNSSLRKFYDEPIHKN